MRLRIIVAVAASALLLSGFKARRNVDASIERICGFYTEALAKHPEDHAGAKAIVEKKREEVFDQNIPMALFNWDGAVLKGWAAIELGHASERYRLFRKLVEQEAGKVDWTCPAMEKFWQAEIVEPPAAPQAPKPQEAAPPASSASDKPVIMGSLDKDVIRGVIRARIPIIKGCYEKQLLENPGLAGKMKVHFVISPDGIVRSAKVLEATIENDEMTICVLAEVQKMVFPEPKGGGIVIVKYPFVFKTH